MGFLDTYSDMDYDTNELEETVTDVVETEVITDDGSDTGSDSTNINEDEILLTGDDVISSETSETIVIDYTEQISALNNTLNELHDVSVIMLCVGIAFIVLKFMKIRKEGDL